MKNTLATHDAGCQIEDYLVLRQAGFTHPDALNALGWEISPDHLAFACRAGISFADIADAAFNDCDLRAYTVAYQHGLTHAELMAVQCAQVDLIEYTTARLCGHNRQELFAALDSGLDLSECLPLADAGATLAEINQSRAAFAPLRIYTLARSADISHADIMGAVNSGNDLPAYIESRLDGYTHSESLTRTAPSAHQL